MQSLTATVSLVPLILLLQLVSPCHQGKKQCCPSPSSGAQPEPSAGGSIGIPLIEEEMLGYGGYDQGSWMLEAAPAPYAAPNPQPAPYAAPNPQPAPYAAPNPQPAPYGGIQRSAPSEGGWDADNADASELPHLQHSHPLGGTIFHNGPSTQPDVGGSDYPLYEEPTDAGEIQSFKLIPISIPDDMQLPSVAGQSAATAPAPPVPHAPAPAQQIIPQVITAEQLGVIAPQFIEASEAQFISQGGEIVGLSQIQEALQIQLNGVNKRYNKQRRV